MNQDVGYGPVAKHQEHPSPQWRTPVLLVALALAVLPTVIYLAGLALNSNAPGTCTDWIGCSHSARQQWAWEVEWFASRGIAVAAFIVAVVHLVPWLSTRAKVRKISSIVALCVLVPLTGLFGLLSVVIWGNECSADSLFCFGGPEDALIGAVPAVVTAVACIVLGVGLTRTRAGQITSTVTISGLAALIASALAGFIGETILTAIATTLFSL